MDHPHSKELPHGRYIPLSEAKEETLALFADWSQEHRSAFLHNMQTALEPGHRDAYHLCALAGDFPYSMRQGPNVIHISEIVLSGNVSEYHKSDKAQKLRDSLIVYIQWSQKRKTLIAAAARALGIPNPYER